MLTCHNLSVRRGGRPVFEHLGFTVGAGTCLWLRGPNGSGKTTLLKMIAGLLRPHEGEVLWDREPIDYWADYGLILNYIGHRNALKGELTVAENLTFWAELREYAQPPPRGAADERRGESGGGLRCMLAAPRRFIASLFTRSPARGEQLPIMAAMAHFGLTDKAHTPVRQLSAGWQRRVALARLLACPAKLWLLDEPATNLDAEGREILQGLINVHLQNTGIVIMASHTEEKLPNESVLDMGDFVHEVDKTTSFPEFA